MKFGVCVGTDIEKMKLIKALGYDYAESNCQDIVNKPQEHIEAMKAVGLPIVAANCFIALKLVGSEKADDAQLSEYLEKLFSRAAYLGLKYLVFGSSGARRIPDGMSVEEGRTDIVRFLKELVVPVAEKYNIIVAIEPLRPAECNAINTVAQGIEVAKAVNSNYVKVLADVKHMYEQNESFALLYSYKGWLVHAHTSNPNPPKETGKKRTYPKNGDGFNQAEFIEPLKAIGVEYCSIEADVVDFSVDVANSYEVLKNLR